MSKDFQYYRKVSGVDTYEKVRLQGIEEVRKELTAAFEIPLDCYEVDFKDRKQKLTICPGSSENIKEITSLPDETFALGSVFDWMGVKYLIHKKDANLTLHTKGQAKRCEKELRWKNVDGELFVYPCPAEDATKYSTGEENGYYVDTGEFQIKVLVTLDANTALIRRGQRFLIDSSAFIEDTIQKGFIPNAFKVTRRNVITGVYNEEGYVELTLCEDQFNKDTDNALELIADDPALLHEEEEIPSDTAKDIEEVF